MKRPGRDSRKKLLNEAKLWRQVCQIKHENVLELYHVFEGDASKDDPKMCMELILPVGFDLIAAGNKYVAVGQVMPVEELAFYFVQMVQAIRHVHRAEVLHRDVKADQFLVSIRDNQDVIKLTDFGLAIPTSVVGTDPWMG